jgi:phospho-N-acetylmuramoyl-pentapeptide-transferase
MDKMFLALIVSFGVTAGMAPLFIPFLRKIKFGQSILEIGPNWHKSKQGTPTMGGIMFMFGTLAACLLMVRDLRAWLALLMALFFGAVGFIDDYLKVVKKQNLGLRAKQKLFLQIMVSLAYLLSLKISGVIDTSIFFPFFNFDWELGWFFYPFAVFVIVATVNSVNLTDGIDGLAAGVTLPVLIFFAVVSFVNYSQPLGVLSCALAGGCAGFLLFNYHPAKVFMGDTGSLFLGGAVCALAFAYDMMMLIPIVGLVYVWEALSVIIQVVFYKKTGKRVFKMAPYHHHLEMCGWSEERIVLVFASATVVLCVIAFLGVLQYYSF